MHNKSSKMQFSYGTGLCRLISLIFRLSLNSRWCPCQRNLKGKVNIDQTFPWTHTAPSLQYEYAQTWYKEGVEYVKIKVGPILTFFIENRCKKSFRIKLWLHLSTTYLLISYFHKTADKVTLNDEKYGWEKTYSCQIHNFVAINEW